MNTELIRVAQIPVIEQRLRSIKPEIERTVAEAKSLACTPDTVISVKKTRSDLRKQREEFEEQRKAVKALILEPLTAFEDIYKECVSDLFESADADLKTKIDDTESAIKSACEDGLREYFSELCAAEHVEWLTYDRSSIKVDMASAKQKTPKKLREQITSFVTGVARGVEAISSMGNAEEIMVEFKRTLDAAEAIFIVQERHRRVEREREALSARVSNNASEGLFIPSPSDTVVDPLINSFSAPQVLFPPTDEASFAPAVLGYVSFKVTGTIQQIKELKKFLMDGGYQFEQLGD